MAERHTVSAEILDRAIRIARAAHATQKDKAGEPFIAHVERVAAADLRNEIAAAGTIDPKLMFKALRMQPEQLGFHADTTIAALTDLVSYAASRNQLGPSGSLP